MRDSKPRDYYADAAAALYGREPATPEERADVYCAAVEAVVAAGQWPRPIAGKGMDGPEALHHARRYRARMALRRQEAA